MQLDVGGNQCDPSKQPYKKHQMQFSINATTKYRIGSYSENIKNKLTTRF